MNDGKKPLPAKIRSAAVWILMMVGVLAVAKFIGGTMGRTAAITEISKEAADQGAPAGFFDVNWGASIEDVRRIRPNAVPQSAGFLAEDVQFYGRRAKISYFFTDNILTMFLFTFGDALGSNETFRYTQDKLVGDYGVMSNPSIHDDCRIYSERVVGRYKTTHCIRMFGDKPLEQVTFYRTNANSNQVANQQPASVAPLPAVSTTNDSKLDPVEDAIKNSFATATPPTSPSTEEAIVSRQFPGWKNEVKSPKYVEWYKKQPPAIQALASSPDAKDAILLLDLYKRDTDPLGRFKSHLP